MQRPRAAWRSSLKHSPTNGPRKASTLTPLRPATWRLITQPLCGKIPNAVARFLNVFPQDAGESRPILPAQRFFCAPRPATTFTDTYWQSMAAGWVDDNHVGTAALGCPVE